MKYKVGDLIEDRRGKFDGDIGVIVDSFFDDIVGPHYKIFWISGQWAGKRSDEPVTEIDSNDNCYGLEQN